MTDLVNDSEMLEMLQGRSLKQAGKALIDLANQRGGHDNITVVMLGIPGWDATQRRLETRLKAHQAQVYTSNWP